MRYTGINLSMDRAETCSCFSLPAYDWLQTFKMKCVLLNARRRSRSSDVEHQAAAAARGLELEHRVVLRDRLDLAQSHVAARVEVGAFERGFDRFRRQHANRHPRPNRMLGFGP